MWLNFVAKLVNSDKFPWIMRNFNFRKNMYVICMLYVWATYNMAQSLCTRVFAPCHVIRLYGFAKFIIISYWLRGIQLPTEGHSVTDWSQLSYRLKPVFITIKASIWRRCPAFLTPISVIGVLRCFLWVTQDIPMRVKEIFPRGLGNIAKPHGARTFTPWKRHLQPSEAAPSPLGA